MNFNGSLRYESWPGHHNISSLHSLSRGGLLSSSLSSSSSSLSSSSLSFSPLRLLTPDPISSQVAFVIGHDLIGFFTQGHNLIFSRGFCRIPVCAGMKERTTGLAERGGGLESLFGKSMEEEEFVPWWSFASGSIASIFSALLGIISMSRFLSFWSLLLFLFFLALFLFFFQTSSGTITSLLPDPSLLLASMLPSPSLLFLFDFRFCFGFFWVVFFSFLRAGSGIITSLLDPSLPPSRVSLSFLLVSFPLSFLFCFLLSSSAWLWHHHTSSSWSFPASSSSFSRVPYFACFFLFPCGLVLFHFWYSFSLALASSLLFFLILLCLIFCTSPPHTAWSSSFTPIGWQETMKRVPDAVVSWLSQRGKREGEMTIHLVFHRMSRLIDPPSLHFPLQLADRE